MKTRELEKTTPRRRIISLSAIGLDSPGLVSKITTKIYTMGGNVIDVEENCRRGLFSIFLIIDLGSSKIPEADIIRALKDLGDSIGLKVVVHPYDEKKQRCSPEHENHLVTIIGLDQPGIIARVSTFFAEANINIENCTMIARGDFFSREMVIDTHHMNIDPSTPRPGAIESMKSDLKALCAGIDLSVVIQSENIYKRSKKLVVFDVESSLIQDFSLKNFLNTVKGRVKTNGSRLDVAQDKTDQMQALIENAKMLKGIPVTEFEKFSDILQINPGTFELIKVLKSMGFKIALLSSGFSFFIKKIFEVAGVDYAFANTLKTDENELTTGELEEPIITSDTKDGILEFILSMENISRDQVIAVGDGSSSSHFIRNVGLSIAFKPNDQEIRTDGILKSDNIIDILYCLGISKDELAAFYGQA